MKRSVRKSAIGFVLVSVVFAAATTSVAQRSAPAPPGDAAQKQEFERKRSLAVAGMTPHKPWRES